MRVYRLWLQSYCMSAVLSGRFSGCSCSRMAMFSSFPCLRARKKSSQYGDVDSEHYSALVKAVVSTRISSQTPESIENEDQWLYGSIVKSKPQVCRALKNPWPLLNDAKRVLDAENVEGSMTRISLQRGSDHASIPSVTKILQKTMSPQQAFYLERWKKKKIAELGVEGFKEYSNSLRNTWMETSVCLLSNLPNGKNSLCVIEWKTSEKPKPFLYNTYDNPLQVAAYIGALNSDKNYNYQVDSGLIVVAYKDGSPAHSHFLKADQVVQYWDKWLFRLEEYMENDGPPSPC
ncbi:mitochondrial genome maintenance exonuclease 1 isoform X2 [Pangasianodon hypophthalmus]|uniref:mitochondrial genome maintenance exonuclease 1 isoform X2 n=1 Tax=Pangasianodon hypophthalmus TaxID=310915 RepID=UPI00147ED35C|nr:mitochondrial genome maintenance exonuclease 1 isoform X2 [Pangasianodon hypophthalmus]